MIEKIMDHNRVVGMIIYQQALPEGVHFFTEDQNPLQIGQHTYKQGKIIKPHRHCPVKTERYGALQEVLYIQKGKVCVTFYYESGLKYESKILNRGDVLLLMEGGHGFEFLEPTEMLEIKQGPYHPDSKVELKIKESL